VRANASFNKIPGFPKISGYKFFNTGQTNILINEKQMLAVVDRVAVNDYWRENFAAVVKE
jgi:hypothetical protein